MARIITISIHSCPLAPLGANESGGMNVYVREVSKQLARRGISIDVFTRAKRRDLQGVAHMSNNVRVVHLPAGKVAPYDKELIANHIEEFAEGIIRFAATQNISYCLIHSHYWLSGLVARKLKEAWGLPIVHMFHTLGKLKNMASRGTMKKEPPKRIQAETEIMGFADRLVAASAIEKAQIHRYYGAPMDKIRVIPCGVDLNLFKPIPKEEARGYLNMDHENILLFVGRIEPIKGIDTLMKALALLKKDEALRRYNLRLVLIGGENSSTGPSAPEETTRLKRMAKELGIWEYVMFLGPLDQRKLPYYYSAADVCVLPSYYESFGLVALEAMACGTPMIASRVGGIPFTIRDGENGYLVTEGEPAELANRVKLVLTDNRVKIKLRDMGVKTVREYAWKTVATRLLSLYNELTDSGIFRLEDYVGTETLSRES